MQGNTLQRELGATFTWAFQGRGYQVSGLTPYQLGQLNAVLEQAFPSAVLKAKADIRELGDLLKPEHRLQLLAEAREEDRPVYDSTGIQISGWPVEFASRQGQAHFFSGRGIGDLLHVILAKHNPITRDQAEALAPFLGKAEIEELMRLIGVQSEEAAEAEHPLHTEQDEPEPDPDLPADYVDPKG